MDPPRPPGTRLVLNTAGHLISVPESMFDQPSTSFWGNGPTSVPVDDECDREEPATHQESSESDSDYSDGEEATPEQWKELDKELDKVVALLKEYEAAKVTETDPVKRYRNLCQLSTTLKTISVKDGGWKILHKEHTEKEKLALDRANFDILKFVYARHEKILDDGKSFITRFELIDAKIADLISRFIQMHGEHSFRAGSLSVAVGFDEFPPELTWRTTPTNKIIMLRPVVIDGVAVLNATMDDDTWMPFMEITKNCRDWIYEPELNLPVKPLTDIILLFLIRGHKTTVYLPKYYQEFLSDCGVSKVDDLVAFQKLIDLGFIKFLEITNPFNFKWFNVVADLADRCGAVFVSSEDYRQRKMKINYSKPSGRIITPCFLNAEDRLLVLDPTIRYRKPGEKTYTVISSDRILQFDEPDDERIKLSEQLYLDQQIKLICSLCQLYPVKMINKVAIKQLLELVVFAGADFEMPGMSIEDYEKLYDRYGREAFFN